MGVLVIEPEVFTGEISPTTSLLQVLIAHGAIPRFSCRQGRCGQDLIRVCSGMEFLNPREEAEGETLEVLQLLKDNIRLACCCRIIGEGRVVIEVYKD